MSFDSTDLTYVHERQLYGSLWHCERRLSITNSQVTPRLQQRAFPEKQSKPEDFARNEQSHEDMSIRDGVLVAVDDGWIRK
ncbi:hypothetical protein KGM_212391 [Danaus plexippus plexippus]|uniref:Uncharacterized protein n=1 Tax=Danaus plexippus plexippus TaxID=278856 RepID=A0A212F825_DANPL|nr:hypothetical protein KGM_212391 [Danaus plexippus plexippus]